MILEIGQVVQYKSRSGMLKQGVVEQTHPLKIRGSSSKWWKGKNASAKIYEEVYIIEPPSEHEPMVKNHYGYKRNFMIVLEHGIA